MANLRSAGGFEKISITGGITTGLAASLWIFRQIPTSSRRARSWNGIRLTGFLVDHVLQLQRRFFRITVLLGTVGLIGGKGSRADRKSSLGRIALLPA